MKLTIGKKITLGFGVLILITAGLGGFGYYTSATSEKSFKQYEHQASDSLLVGGIEANILAMQSALFRYLQTGKEEYSKMIDERSLKVDGLIKEAEKDISDPTELKLLSEIHERHEKDDAEFEKLKEIYAEREKYLNGPQGAYTVGPQIISKLEELKNSAYSDNEVSEAYHISETLALVYGAQIYAFKFFETSDLAHVESAKKHFKEMDQSFTKLKEEIENSSRHEEMVKIEHSIKEYEEDFEKTVHLIEKRNELRADIVAGAKIIATDIEKIKLDINAKQHTLGPQIAQSLVQAEWASIIVSSLSVLVGVLLGFFIGRSIISVLSRITQELAETSVQNASASQQLSAASQQLSAGATEQASSIEETSSSLEEITGMVENNVANAEKAYELSKQMQLSSQDANDSMQNLQESMKQILESNEKIRDLVKVITNIADKTEVMDEIVFQTKLLSFNASVEAERAGEHGRGFAVVAQEVGNLAQMSGKAAQEIAQIVKESIVNAESITEENKKKVEIGSEIVRETAKILVDISESAGTVSQGSHQVLEASQDQSKGIQQISMAMNQVDTATQQNAATAEETASTSEELSAQTENLDRLVDQLNQMVTGHSIDKRKGFGGSVDSSRPSMGSKLGKVVQMPSKKTGNSSSEPNVDEEFPKVANGDGWDRL